MHCSDRFPQQSFLQYNESFCPRIVIYILQKRVLQKYCSKMGIFRVSNSKSFSKFSFYKRMIQCKKSILFARRKIILSFWSYHCRIVQLNHEESIQKCQNFKFSKLHKKSKIGNWLEQTAHSSGKYDASKAEVKKLHTLLTFFAW